VVAVTVDRLQEHGSEADEVSPVTASAVGIDGTATGTTARLHSVTLLYPWCRGPVPPSNILEVLNLRKPLLVRVGVAASALPGSVVQGCHCWKWN
jgi:hypothetical protein